MPENENHRSEEVQEILGYIPHWMIRWGITLLFMIILGALFLSWMVHYPDLVEGKVVLTTKKPPIRVVNERSGTLKELLVEDQEQVKKGQFLAEIQNPVGRASIAYLSEFLEEVDTLLTKKDHQLTIRDSGRVFGDIQSEYSGLKSSTQQYSQFLKDPWYKKRIHNLKTRIKQYDQMVRISKSQVHLTREEYEDAREKFQADRKLYEEGVIAQATFFKKQSEFRQKKQELESVKKTVVQNEITLSDLEKQQMDLQEKHEERERELRKQIRVSQEQIRSRIRSWQQVNILEAPADGKVTWLKDFEEGTYYESGAPLFAVVPENDQYVARVFIKAQGAGKIEKGQAVRIRLAQYPPRQYGVINGKVDRISEVTDGENYLLKVKLIQGLVTSYGKKIRKQPEMTGTAEVVTTNRRLLNRIFSKFRELVEV